MQVDAVRLTFLLHQYQAVIDALLDERRVGARPLGTSDLKSALHAYERLLICQALHENTTVRQTAKVLGVERTTLINRIQRLKIHVKEELKPR